MAKQSQFCSYCGASLEKKFIDEKMRDHCPQCKAVFYENPLPVASTIVVNKNREVLLVQRKKDPYKDMWCLPIGFAESDEKVEEAALRELKEEAGVDGELVQLIDVDTVDNYFYGSLAIVTYEARVTGGKVQAGDDAKAAGFFPINEIPQLAWTSNERALKKYLEIHRSNWAFEDLLEKMLPEVNQAQRPRKDLMPELLTSIIRERSIDIEQRWIAEIEKSLKMLLNHQDFLEDLHMLITAYLIDSLEGKKEDVGVMSPDAMPDSRTISAAVILHRKNLWKEVMDQALIASPVDALEALELNNRIVSLYDRILYKLL
jgi:8-oxo-dGTP diphosphatase